MKSRLAVACCLALTCFSLVATGQDAPAPAPGGLPHAWPPVKGEPYPDLELLDHRGETVKLSSFRGKVVVVEPVGMGCPACQAYTGAHTRGVFRGGTAQDGLPSLDEALARFAKIERRERQRNLVLVQLLLYGMDNRTAPTVDDARAWAEHFKLDGAANTVVFVGDERYVNSASYALVPGFHVIDKRGVLRFDAAGHRPRDNPYTVALAGIPGLLAERR